MNNRVVGIDYSMTSPAICILQGEHMAFTFWTRKKKNECEIQLEGCSIKGILFDYKGCPDEERFNYLATEIFQASKSMIPTRIILEDYSYASTGRAFQIGENTGVLKNRFHRSGFEIEKVAPTQVKKFATGKGNADKELMQAHFLHDTGLDIKQILGQTEKQWNPSSDIIDAYYIASYGKRQ